MTYQYAIGAQINCTVLDMGLYVYLFFVDCAISKPKK